MTRSQRRRPVEAIESRNRRTAECEERVRKTVSKLARTGLPFTVEEVCRRADVGKTFIYDKKRPELTKLVLSARDTSQLAIRKRIGEEDQAQTASWQARALNAEAEVKEQRALIRQQDAYISDLAGQIFDPEGNHLADENARLRAANETLMLQLTNAEHELSVAKRSLQASRANHRREQERSLSMVQTPLPHLRGVGGGPTADTP